MIQEHCEHGAYESRLFRPEVIPRVLWPVMAYILSSVFVLIGSPIGAAPPTIDKDSQRILAAIDGYSSMYHNVEVAYVKNMTYRVLGETDPKQTIVSRVTDVHATWQDDFYLWTTTDELNMADGTTKSFRSKFGFDGTATRANDKQEVGNISDQRIPVYPWQPPHLLGTPDFGEFSLSEVLSLRRTTPPMPFFQNVDRTTTRYMGKSEVNGLSCEVLSTQFLDKQGNKVANYTFDVAPDRNYIVARTTKHALHDAKRTVARHVVTEWKEEPAGIWFPVRISGDYFDATSGETDPFLTEVVAVSKTSLSVEYDQRHFADVGMPANGVVYEIRGGSIVSRSSNAEVRERSSSLSSVGFWVALNSAIILILGIAILVRRRVRQT